MDTLTTIVQGSTTYLVTPEGRARVENPRYLHGARVPTLSALPKAPQASKEDTERWAARLSREIGTAMLKCSPRILELSQGMVGQPAGDGFVVVATDGARALLKRAVVASPAKNRWATQTPTDDVAFDVPADLQTALRRMLAANNDKEPCVRMAIDARDARLTLFTHAADGTEAQEWLPLSGQLRTMVIGVNAKFLASALGLQGAKLYATDDVAVPLRIDSADGQYRLVIMPTKVQQAPSWQLDDVTLNARVPLSERMATKRVEAVANTIERVMRETRPTWAARPF